MKTSAALLPSLIFACAVFVSCGDKDDADTVVAVDDQHNVEQTQQVDQDAVRTVEPVSTPVSDRAEEPADPYAGLNLSVDERYYWTSPETADWDN